MQRWPWISLLLVAALAVSPIGWGFIYSAFFSNEQLSRNIAQPFVFGALAVAAVIVGLEWLIRRAIGKRRMET